jgi:hypothetical protein
MSFGEMLFKFKPSRFTIIQTVKSESVLVGVIRLQLTQDKFEQAVQFIDYSRLLELVAKL